MAVRLRLTRKGKKKQPTYRVVAAESRFSRDGRFIEIIGFYDPAPDPSEVRIDNEKALKWLKSGAQPSERVQKLLEVSGAWEEFTGVAPTLTSATPKKEKRAAKKEKEKEAEAGSSEDSAEKPKADAKEEKEADNQKADTKEDVQKEDAPKEEEAEESDTKEDAPKEEAKEVDTKEEEAEDNNEEQEDAKEDTKEQEKNNNEEGAESKDE